MVPEQDVSDVNDESLAEASAAAMYAGDHLVHHLGIEVVTVSSGEAVTTMIIKPEMVNGHAICHGGVVFSLADAALAYASNSHGGTVVASGVSIEFLAPAHVGDKITATATETHLAGRNGHYDMRVTRSDGTVIALLKGRCRRIADPDPGQ